MHYIGSRLFETGNGAVPQVNNGRKRRGNRYGGMAVAAASGIFIKDTSPRRCGHPAVAVTPPYRHATFAVSLLFMVAAISILHADPPALLPAPIKALLDLEYPGWKFAPASREVLLEFEHHHANHPPWFLAADFDGDGQTDYAVEIVHGGIGREEQSVIAYKVRDGAYEETVLESLGPNTSIYLGSTKQTYTDTGADGGNRLFMKDRLVIMGGELGETSYEYENGKFQEVSPDDAQER